MTLLERTFSTSRTLPYPPEAVYAAFASADLLASWWGPAGFSNTFEQFDFQVGGRWRFVMHGPDGRDHANDNVFTALEPGARVVIRHDGAPYFVLSIGLAPAAGGTRLTWDQTFDDARTAQAVRSVVVPANEENLDRLERALQRAAGGEG